MEITYQEILKKYARVCVEKTFRHAHLIGLSNSKKYDENLYDNVQLLGSAIYQLFPNEWCESEFWKEVRKVELNGVLVQISRASVGEIPSGILSDPKTPCRPAKLINKSENIINNLDS